MCDPATAVTLVAAGSSLVGGLVRGNAARQAGEFAGAIEDRNAVIADKSATYAIARGQTEEGIARIRGGQKIAAQTAGYAASGVDVGSGSAQDVTASTALVNEFDAQMIRSNAAREAWGFQAQAGQFRLRAQLARQTGQAQGDEAILSGVTGAASYGSRLLQIGGTARPGGGTPPVPSPSYSDWGE